MSQRVDSKPYVLDRLFEISEVLYDIQSIFDRKIPPEKWNELMDEIMQKSDKASEMLEKVLENPWWGGRITHDRSEDPLKQVEDDDNELD